MAIPFFAFVFSDTCNDDRREGILVFERHIVFPYDCKCCKKVFAADSDGVFDSFDRCGEGSYAGTDFRISGKNIDFPVMERTNTGVVIVLACDEIDLLECTDEVCAKYCGFCL